MDLRWPGVRCFSCLFQTKITSLLGVATLCAGKEGVGEIPGGATLSVDVELLSIKTSPTG